MPEWKLSIVDALPQFMLKKQIFDLEKHPQCENKRVIIDLDSIQDIEEGKRI